MKALEKLERIQVNKMRNCLKCAKISKAREEISNLKKESNSKNSNIKSKFERKGMNCEEVILQQESKDLQAV